MRKRIQFSFHVILIILFFSACSKNNHKSLTLGKQGKSEIKQIDTAVISPSIFWVSDPVQPGEVVMVAGANWGESPHIELSRLRDKKPDQPVADAALTVQKSVLVKPLQVTSSSVKFLIPEGWKAGVYSFQITAGGTMSVPMLANAPDPWWQQGDWGREASPGSWLRIFGKCLSLNGQATIALRDSSKTLILTPTQQDMWSLSVTLPTKMMAGEYETWVHNGCGGQAGWKRVGAVMIKQHPPLWKSDVFDVRDYGATGNDEYDDGAAVQAALDAADRNGGGIVLIPRGLFQINSTLSIPRLVLLKGEGSNRSQLYWRDRINPLDALIRGTNSFGIEDLTITATNHLSAVMSDPGTKPHAGNVFLRRLQIRINRFKQVKVHFASDRVGSNWQSVDRRLSAVAIEGLNVQVTDCDIYSSQAPFRFNGNYGLFSDNSCFEGGTSAFISGTQIIFENNVYEGSQVGRGGGDYVRQNLYYAHNRVGNMEFEDGELFTSDGHAGKREVTFASIAGIKATLAEDVEWKNLAGPEWTGNSIHEVVLSIVGGTGYGQHRFIKAYKGREVELERPWDVLPDKTSLISLSRCFKNNLLVGNDFHDGGWVQSYCMGINWVIAENKITRCGGINNNGHGISPSWFNQYINNEILVGGSLGSPPRDSHLAVYGGVGARFTVFRRNVLDNNSMIATNINRWGSTSGASNDVVIDHNIIRDTDIGLNVTGRSNGVLIWRNDFERIKEPIIGLSDGVFMHPAERLINLLSAEGLIPMKLQGSPAWQKAWKRLESLQTKDPTFDALLDDVRLCQAELAKTMVASLPEGQSLKLLQALTGLTFVETSSAELQTLLSHGRGGTANSTITAFLPEWSLPMKLSLSLPPLPGWQTTTPVAVEVKPGGNATSNITLIVPTGVWGKPTIPLTCTVTGQDWLLRGSGKVQLANLSRISPDQVSQWMVVGPFSSNRIAEWPLSFHAKQEALLDTLFPQKYLKDININSKYQGARGIVRWQPVATGNIDFTGLYGSVKNGVAYAMTVLRVAIPTKVAITSGTESTMIYLDGEILGLPYHRWGHDLLSRTLTAGDHVLLCSVPQTFNSGTKTINKWQLSVKVMVDPASTPGDVQIVPVEKLRKVATLTSAAIP